MGQKDSKQSFLQYEDAVRRVSDAELKRLKEAFKRSSTISGFLTKQMFIKEVLGDGVPLKLAELVFETFGGNSKGLTFKELLCGLVLLTRGRQEERVKFLFGLYGNDSLTHVQKEEMDRIVCETEGGGVPQALSQLFLESDKISYEYFRSWILQHPDVTSVSRWFFTEPCTLTLTDDSEMPTFYQTLAGVTHLEEGEIVELEKHYWILKAQSKTGRFDLETFKAIVCPPIPEKLSAGLFNAFDENRDNHIDFKEIACGISACCKGPRMERQKFCFKIFDHDHDGLLSRADVEAMVEAMLSVKKENHSSSDLSSNRVEQQPSVLADNIMKVHDSHKDGFITQEEYLVWTVNEPLADELPKLLLQLCHVALGLKPQTREEEGQVIVGWLERENRRGLQVGQTWYLVSMSWWKSWLENIYFDPNQLQKDFMQGLTNEKKSISGRSLCKNLGRRHVSGIEDDSVVMTSANSISGTDSNGIKYHTLPRGTSGTYPSHTRQDSGTQSEHNYSSSQNSKQPSPNLSIRSSTSSVPVRPAAIDNTPLVAPNSTKLHVPVLTNEGGQLRRNVPLLRNRDFELLPEPVWKALQSWYGGAPVLPRNVIATSATDPTPYLELYPIHVKLLRHQLPPKQPQQVTPSFTSMLGGMGAYAMNATGMGTNQPQIPRKYLAYTASFSRQHTLRQVMEFLLARLRINKEDLRLWKYQDENNMTLLEDEDATMEALGIPDDQQLLIEVRNKDLTWPEEMSQLAKNRAALEKKQLGPTEPGATGLNNLGNTCYMNTALQCVSNTQVLTLYFNYGMHLFELNRTNPLGMKGHIAHRYGELVKDLWSGTNRSLAPLKFRWTIGKYAPRFNGFQQHDSQEFLAFLLDGLHEDLNRVHEKPYVELRDSDGRPDEEVASEAWENHFRRNQSVVVDLFHGQLRSHLRCLQCNYTSVRFDPFTYLSLPLPMESCIHLEIIVATLDGKTPMRYGLRLNMDEKYIGLKKELSKLCGIPAQQLLLVEICGPLIKSFPADSTKVKGLIGDVLYAYELPPPSEKVTTVATAGDRNSTALQNGINEVANKGSDIIQRSILTNSTTRLPPINNTKGEEAIGKLADSLKPLAPPTSRSPQWNGVQKTSPVNGSIPGEHGNNNNTPSNTSVTYDSITSSDRFDGFLVAVHRKMIRMDQYFLSSQKTRPSLFGTPLILPCSSETTHQDLYQAVWSQVSRLVSPLPPSEAGHHNHAQDCDDSMRYEYPFILKVVQKDGLACSWCPWYRFCRGCRIMYDTEKFNFASAFLAVDWEPTALHLRYQSSIERLYEEHGSVEESRRLQTDPISIDTCLQAFTKEEELGEDELWYCSKCKKHQLAVKKLSIWRLPPVLIVHLKRFQYLNGRWVKSQKIVKFPKVNFDASRYVGRKKELEDPHPASNELSIKETTENQANCVDPVSFGDIELKDATDESVKQSTLENDPPLDPGETPPRLTNNSTHSPPKDAKLSPTASQPNSEMLYDLYAMSCHTGILGGGHYVAYTRNPNGKWYCYNDSSCKEVPEEQISTDNAYILFYEQKGLNYSQFMPDTTGQNPDMAGVDDECESDLRKMCCIQ